jgi:hypothetical protein
LSIAEFKKDPVGYLNGVEASQSDRKVVQAPSVEAASTLITEANQTKFFKMSKVEGTLGLLLKIVPKADDALEAYWLPWKQSVGIELELKQKAEWFFTAEMTGCRFSYLRVGDRTVATHLAAEMGLSARNTFEETISKRLAAESKVDPRSPEMKPFSDWKRLSSRGAKTIRDKAGHGYFGEGKDEQSSAFVFGRCDGGKWKFYRQVVKSLPKLGDDFFKAGAFPVEEIL